MGNFQIESNFQLFSFSLQSQPVNVCCHNEIVPRTWNRDDLLCSIYAAIIWELIVYDGPIIYADRLMALFSKRLGSSWLSLALLATTTYQLLFLKWLTGLLTIPIITKMLIVVTITIYITKRTCCATVALLFQRHMIVCIHLLYTLNPHALW